MPMTFNQSKDEAAYLACLFPSISGDQARFWIKEFQRFEQPDVRRAIDEHQRQHEFVSPPQLLNLLKQYASGQRTGPSAQAPSSGTRLAAEKELPATPSGKAEAILREFRGQWFVYARSLNDRLTGCGAGEPVAAMATRQAEGERTRCRAAVVGCLIEEGVTYDAACAWAESIFWDVGDFRDALTDLRAGGIELAPAEVTHKPLPFLRIFHTPETQHDTKRQQLERLAEQLAVETKAAPTLAEQTRAEPRHRAPVVSAPLSLDLEDAA